MIRSKLHKLLAKYPHKHMPRDPFFAFSDEVTDLLAGSSASVNSMKALMEHGLVHLPYPQMTVQFHQVDSGVTWVLWLQELPDGKFNGDLFAHKTDIKMGFMARSTLSVDPDAKECFDVVVKPAQDVLALAERREEVELMADDVGYVSIAGLQMAVLMTHLGGLEREVHDAPEKLNKARRAKGEPPVRTYTYVHVGHVYNQAGERVAYERGGSGRRMPIHMRAGHNRNQFYGEGRALRKLIWIPPVLVNYDGETKPVVEKRVVL